MKPSACHRVLLSPTPEQAKALALQIVAVNKIIQGCPSGNPFGQSKGTFKLQYDVDLWPSVNMAMMGFSEVKLRDPMWKRQINYRGNRSGLDLYRDPDTAEWGIYMPQLETEAGYGRVRALGEPLELPSGARPMYMTLGVDDDKRWWANVFVTSKPPMKYAKRRRI